MTPKTKHTRFGRRPGRRAETPAVFLFALILQALVCANPSFSREERLVTPERIQRFEASLERFQRDLQIPGMAAAVVEDGKVLWAKGFGYADTENGTPATPETPFQLCSVTKAVAAVIIHQLVEEGKMDLDTPLAEYGIDLDDSGTVRLIHLITHTSQGVPGAEYKYHGDRYGYLDTAIKRATGKSFRTYLIERVIDPLGMKDTAPNPADPEVLDRFMAYREEHGLSPDPGFFSEESFVQGDLFDYDDESFDPTINRAMSLLADYFDSQDVKRGEFLRYVSGHVDTVLLGEFTAHMLESGRFMDVYRKLARPHTRDDSGVVIPGQYSMFFNPAAGLNSSVLDMAKFDIALDSGQYISERTWEKATTPYRLSGGGESPYGMGWFSEEYGGVRLIWHGGEWRCASALYLKVPEKDLTLMIAANSRAMSQAFGMGAGTVLNSGVGLEFLRLFVYEPEYGAQGPDIDWTSPSSSYTAELERMRGSDLEDLFVRILKIMESMYAYARRSDVTQELFRHAHRVLLPASLVNPYEETPVIAELVEVGDGFDGSAPFSLDEETLVHVYAIGEMNSDGEYDRAWIEEAASGDMVWRMALEKTSHAGGAERNRKSDETVLMSSGRYVLRYVSDDSHSYMAWYGAPPDHLFWGVQLRR